MIESLLGVIPDQSTSSCLMDRGGLVFKGKYMLKYFEIDSVKIACLMGKSAPDAHKKV